MWSAGMYAALILSAGIGLSLGLVGGGGSIITVPILVYVAGLPPREAVPLSLAVVGATAAVGAVAQWRAGQAHLRAALVLGLTGMLGAPLGAKLTPLVPPPVLMLLFAALMFGVGLRMIRSESPAEKTPAPECQPLKCGLAGLGIGILTGFLGVGGGFLIVPALLRYAHTPMRQAVGTSLLIITASSFSGLIAHREEFRGHLDLAAAFIGMALLGLATGMVLAKRLRPARLKQVFGGIALAVALYLVAMNAGPLFHLATRG